jgi:hypothetical protein
MLTSPKGEARYLERQSNAGNYVLSIQNSGHGRGKGMVWDNG